jgi:hypothetical protein
VGGLGQLFCFPRKIVEFPIYFCLVYLQNIENLSRTSLKLGMWTALEQNYAIKMSHGYPILCAKIVLCVCGNSQVEKNMLLNSEHPWFGENPKITMTRATFALLTLTGLILEIKINGHILNGFRPNDLFHIQVKHLHWHQRVLNQILWKLNKRI